MISTNNNAELIEKLGILLKWFSNILQILNNML
jgi:hypothetical protein